MNEEILTDKQLETILRMVKMIIEGCETKEEAVEKIEELLKDYE